MHLKSLTLKGFKSFAQPTTFAFEPGITCVIGPNGSGKSNVVDALAWVMGEQGAKTLRGATMEDVIFAGTSSRGPLGRAEVSLTIDNTDGALPIDYSEVTISRTLFRNGGSEYALNGESCRLYDLQELLSDSGLGREMHVIVGQGQLDAILHATPETRRSFIEEAAGIVKYRRRKEKTHRKLEAMQGNLTRLSDVVGEIRRQLKPLGRQAEVAKHAQTVAAVVRDARARLFADEVLTVRSAYEAYLKSEKEQHLERVILQEKREHNQAVRARIEQAQRNDAVDSARRVAYELESVQERLRGLYTLANQRLVLLGKQNVTVVRETTVTTEMVEHARTEVENCERELIAAENSWNSAQALTLAARKNRDIYEEQVIAHTAALAHYETNKSVLASQVESERSRLVAVQGDVSRCRRACEEADERRRQLHDDRAALEADSALAESSGDDHDDAYETASAELSQREEQIEQLRERLHSAERERDALIAKREALAFALDEKDASRELITSGFKGLRGFVADHIRVVAGYETAIAVALGSVNDAVLAQTREAAFAALNAVHEKELGQVDLVVSQASSVQPFQLSPALREQGFVSAAEVVEGPVGVVSLLAKTLIADHLDTVQRAWSTLRSEWGGITVITQSGDVVTEHMLRGGSRAKLSRVERVAEREAARQRLAECETEISRLSAGLAEEREAYEGAKENAARAMTAVRERDLRIAAQKEKLSRLTAHCEASQAEYERLELSLAHALKAAHEAERSCERATSEHEQASVLTPPNSFDSSQQEPLIDALETAQKDELQARLFLETARERFRVAKENREAKEEQHRHERESVQQYRKEEALRLRQIDAATVVTEILPAVLDSVDLSVVDARLERSRCEKERLEQNEELVNLRKAESEAEERLQRVMESLHSLELQSYEKKLHRASVLERVSVELGLTEDVLLEEYGPDQLIVSEENPEGVPFDRREQEKRLAEAERMFAELGRVNPLALEEFAALEQRHAFLTEQLADLTSTRAELLKLIGEIDLKMKDIFESAFLDTQKAFSEVFPVLFPGGSGSIQLCEPNNLLTTGVEISVKPAGKKIERLSLLSGGERSLAAVALLIAIFKARPSPFYIMDEVEAALDDTNLGRLLTIFAELRSHSQLIIVTHQKRTMEIADALYGVSMQHDGVSAVIGQRVNRETSDD